MLPGKVEIFTIHIEGKMVNFNSLQMDSIYRMSILGREDGNPAFASEKEDGKWLPFFRLKALHT